MNAEQLHQKLHGIFAQGKALKIALRDHETPEADAILYRLMFDIVDLECLIEEDGLDAYVPDKEQS